MEQKVLRHVVLFKFNDDTSTESMKEIEQAFMDLRNKIQIIESIEWGKDVSPEGLSQGFTHCFFVTFSSEENRDAYIPHPDHQEFVSLMGSFVEKVLVVDYWACN